MSAAREIDGALADKIIKKIGDEVWLVFDMDGTLANLKNEDATILRPTLNDFFSKFTGKTVYFGIYSNNHTLANLDLVAEKIMDLPAVKINPNFHVCFKVHNFHPFRAGIENVKIENDLITTWDRDKTYATIKHAYTYGDCTHPIDNPNHVFFFDDRDHYSVKKDLGKNYIHVSEYKKPATTKQTTRTKRGRNEISKSSKPRSRKYRKTQRKYRR
jgi:hypothetical protein